MPNPRWWTFEDGKVNFGSVNAATTDLAKLLFDTDAVKRRRAVSVVSPSRGYRSRAWLQAMSAL